MRPSSNLDHMKASIQALFLLSSFLIPFDSFSQSYEKAIGGKGSEKAFVVIPSPQGFLVGGETASFGLKDQDALLTAVNKKGDILWTRTYGGDGVENFNDLQPTNDGGYLGVGENYENGGNKEATFALKTDGQGNMVWNKQLKEGDKEVEGFSIAPAQDGGFVITGVVKTKDWNTSSFTPANNEKPNLYLLKIDQKGNKIWSFVLAPRDAALASKGRRVIPAHDGGFLVTGHTFKNGNDKETDLCLLKVDKNGQKEWLKIYKGTAMEGESGADLRKTPEGYLITGNTSSAGAGDSDLLLMSVDKRGQTQWIKTYGGQKNEISSGFTPVNDGGYVLYGGTHSSGNGAFDGIAVKVDPKGKALWARTYGGNSHDQILSGVASDYGFVFAGLTVGMGNPGPDTYLIQTDKNGRSNCNDANIDYLRAADHTSAFQEETNTKATWETLSNVTERTASPQEKVLERKHSHTESNNLCH